MKKLCSTIALACALGVGSVNAARQMEALDRGLVAVKTTSGVFLSWRVLGTDGSAVGFNLYRDGAKIASFSGTDASNYVDAQGTASSKYAIRPVVAGVEKSADKTVSVWGEQKLTINLDRPAAGSDYTYSPNDIAVGDVDGDGEYELILKWDPSNSKDNSQKGKTGKVYIDCYKFNGKKLWRIDLGVNIRAGAHYTQMLVGDYDSDGKAEVAFKTAPGTKDGSGKYLSKGPAASVDHSKDYRNSNGYVLSGEEFLTIFNGETGVEMATVNFNPGRGTVSSWGDSYGNRVDRFLATNAYLDGQKPSMVFQRGYYTRMAVTAYDWDGKSLTQRWYYNAATKGSECYGMGNHNISAGDVDGDGFDEIIEGSCAIDHNGKFMYRTGKGHGDAIHFGDLDPDHAGLEVWEVHEEKPYGYDLHDARTGAILWSANSDADNGRGVAADVDSTSRGYEMWSAANWNTYSATGKVLATSRPAYNFRIYFDGDLLDELLDNTTISKWNSSTSKSSTLLSMQGNSCNSTKATPNFSGDLFGDWREEVILHDGASKLYVYTTTIPTKHRLYTLAHDPIYRNGMSWQNTAYNQPPHLGFWLGAGVSKAPTPDIVLVGGEAVPKIPAIQKQGAGSSFQTVMLGDAIIEYAFGYTNCTGLKIEGLPSGVTATQDAANSRYVIKGTPKAAGVYEIKISTVGGDAEFDAATRTASITVLAKATTVETPTEILSTVDAAFPTDGDGTTDTNHVGFNGKGFFNVTNSTTSYGLWKLNAIESGKATFVIRYSYTQAAGNADRQMKLTIADDSGKVTDYGIVTFAPTADWDTWNTVSVPVNFVEGLNVVTLQSMSEQGGPNLDAFEFDVKGVTLYGEEYVDEDSETIVEGSGSSSEAPESSSSSDEDSDDAETDFIENLKVARGVHLNFADATIVAREAGFVELNLFDARGKLMMHFADYVSAGATNVNGLRNLKNGLYYAQVKFNGKVSAVSQLHKVK